MAAKNTLLPSPQLLSSPMMSGGYDYFRQEHQEPEKRSQFSHPGKKRLWHPSSEDNFETSGHAYLTPDPSSQLGFSSPPHPRRALASIPILRPKVSGKLITIGRSSIKCTHPIPQQFLNLHISRVHVIAAYVPETRELSVLCKGLNPVYVDTQYETTKIEKGQEIRFQEGEDIKINIAGYVVIVEAPEYTDDDISEAPLPNLEPPSIEEPPYAEPEKKSQPSPVETSPPESKSPSPLPLEDASEPLSQLIHIYHDAPLSPQSSLSPPPEQLSPPQVSPSCSPRSRTISNPALLDALLTTLIFAEVKPTPLPRLLNDLSHRMPSVTQEEVSNVLENTACIGVVHRSGKDAAGKELSNEYYYIAENDDNEARRERYYQFARPTRSCRLKHSQYHWRPVKLHSHKTKGTFSSPGKENMGGRGRKKMKKEHLTEDDVKKVMQEEIEVMTG